MARPGRNASGALPVEVYAPGLDAPRWPLPVRLQAVERELTATSREAAALSGPALQVVLPVLDQARREVARDMRRWVASVPDGDLRFTAQQYRNVLLHLRQAFETIASLDPAMAGGLARATRAAGLLSAQHLRHEVARFSEIFEGSSRPLPLNLTRILATGERHIIPRVRTSAARYAGNVANDIRRHLAIGIVRGDSVSALTDRLVRLGGPRGTVALRGVAGEPGAVTEQISEGLFRRYRYWAERVVRTETQNAYNVQLDEGLREAADEIPGLLRRWDASLDLRICEICAALHGATARIGQAFPGGYTSAPAHPNCRCRVGAWKDDWNEILRAARSRPLAVQDAVAGTSRTSSSTNAPAPPPSSGGSREGGGPSSGGGGSGSGERPPLTEMDPLGGIPGRPPPWHTDDLPRSRRTLDESARRLLPQERRTADLLTDQGNDVRSATELQGPPGRQADVFVNGTRVEIKNPDPGATSRTVRNRVNDSRRRGGQARSVIVDARGTGLSRSEADHAIRMLRPQTRGKIDYVRIIGDGFDLTYSSFR